MPTPWTSPPWLICKVGLARLKPCVTTSAPLRRLAAALDRIDAAPVCGTALLVDLHPMRIERQPSADVKSMRLWAEDHESWLTMQASAEQA